MDPSIRLQNVFYQIRNRCCNPNSVRYHWYGARGIGVYWQTFAEFRAYVEQHLGPRPPGYSMDRIDNSKGYEPGNIRWASPTQQARNTRRNRLLTHAGVTQTLTEWSNETGIPISSIRGRLRLGWTVDDALTIPTVRGNRYSIIRSSK